MNELVQILKNTRQHLMTGVSHMIPFVVSGGILLAVSVMLYGKGAVPDAVADPNLKKLFDIGVAGLTLMVPFLAAYIGYSIAERSALAPCAIGAWVGNSFGAGFFGALIAGIIALRVYHLNFHSAAGLIAGAMTDTPALAYIGTLSGRNIAAVAYSTVYPVSMFLRILSGQLVLLFVWGAIA